MLLKWGNAQADRLGLPVYLEATADGKRLYEKHGFKAVDTIEFDFAKWGGGMHKSWAMVWGEDDHDESKE